jgi:Flp pilus assembly pilin Flp
LAASQDAAFLFRGVPPPGRQAAPLSTQSMLTHSFFTIWDSMRTAMSRFKRELHALRVDRAGVTALEYGILAGVPGLVLIAIFKGFGTTLTTVFVKIGSSV